MPEQPPSVPGDLHGAWVNDQIAFPVPVLVERTTDVHLVVDAFQPGAIVDVEVDYESVGTERAAESGRVEFSLDTTNLTPGVHLVEVSATAGVLHEITARVRVAGNPPAGTNEWYRTVLCCFSGSTDDEIQLTVNGQDWSMLAGRPGLSGGLVVEVPVPDAPSTMEIEATNRATEESLSETVVFE